MIFNEAVESLTSPSSFNLDFVYNTFTSNSVESTTRQSFMIVKEVMTPIKFLTKMSLMNETNQISTNVSFTLSPKFSILEVYSILILTLIVSIITVAGNILVIMAFIREPSIRQPNNYLIIALASTDLLIGLMSMPLYSLYIVMDKWVFGGVVCDLWLSIDYTLCLISQYTVLLITIDRFCSVKIAARYRSWRTPGKLKLLIFIICIIPTIIFFGSIFGWPIFNPKYNRDPNECVVPFRKNKAFNVGLIFFYYWFSLAVLLILYFGIYKVAADLAKKADKRKEMLSERLKVAQNRDANKSHTKAKIPNTTCNSKGEVVVKRDAKCAFKSLFPLRFHAKKNSNQLCMDLLPQPCPASSSSSSTSKGKEPPHLKEGKIKKKDIVVFENKNAKPINKVSLGKIGDNKGLFNQNKTTHTTTKFNSKLREALLPSNMIDMKIDKSSERINALKKIYLKQESVDVVEVKVDPDSTKKRLTVEKSINDALEEEEDDDDESSEEVDEDERNCSSINHPIMEIIKCNILLNPLIDMTGSSLEKLGQEESEANKNTEESGRKKDYETFKASVQSNAVKDKFFLNTSSKKKKVKGVNRAKKALRTITCIMGAFVICWTPYHVIETLFGLLPYENFSINVHIYHFSYWLCYLNSPLNPFMYALSNNDFKKAFIKILSFKNVKISFFH